jgi:hypothetical protein
MPVLKNMSVGSAMIASTTSFSSTWRRISLSPEPAPPVNSGEPLSTMPMRLPPSCAGCIFDSRCSRNSSEPSEMRGRAPG